jgi:hypothetical protein
MSGHKLTRGQRTAKLAAAVAVLGIPALVQADPYPRAANVGSTTHWFADWEVNTNNAPTDFFITPFANNGSVASVKAALQVSANQDRPTGIKITNTPLSSASALSIFNSTYGMSPHQVQPVSYVFCDFEGADSNDHSATAINNSITKVKQVVQWANASSQAGRNYIGEFALTPLKGVGFNYADGEDPTRRGTLPFADPGNPKKNQDRYKDSKVNMANTDLYPGAPNYRNKSTGDWANGNIRTGLFVAPLGRMTAVQNVLNNDFKGLKTSVQNDDNHSGTQYHKQIPWVTRFNNYGNNSLNNFVVAGKPYAFKPGIAAGSLTASQTANQMLGRGDFSAQIQHYRMRGAYTVNLFEPGVVGYSKLQMQDDVRAGWYGGSLNPGDPNSANATSLSAIAHVNSIYGQADSKAATMTLNPVIDGTSLSSGIRSENSGTIWSGEYSKNMKKLDILASNLDTVNHMIRFGKVDAYEVFTLKNGSGDVYDDKVFTAANRRQLIEAGMHRMLQFDLVSTKVWSKSTYTGTYHTKTVWLLNQNYLVFSNNAGRGDTGIPEPTTFGMLAAAGSMSLVCRRHRNKATA